MLNKLVIENTPVKKIRPSFVVMDRFHLPQSQVSLEKTESFTIKLYCLSPKRLKDVFKTSSRLVFKTSSRLQTCLEDVLKTKNCYAEDVLKVSSRGLQEQQVFAGSISLREIIIIAIL